MSYAELIKELQKRSGLGVKEYAEAVNYSPAHISNILNDKQPGSIKALQACLKHAKLDIEDCLTFPVGTNAEEDAMARHAGTVRRLVAVLELEEPIAETIRTQIYGVYEHWVKRRKAGKASAPSGTRH